MLSLLYPAVFTVNFLAALCFANPVRLPTSACWANCAFFLRLGLDFCFSCCGPTFCQRIMPPVPSEDDNFVASQFLILMRDRGSTFINGT